MARSAAGIGSTAFGQYPDTAIETLAIRAADAAIRETGIDWKRLGALYLGNFAAGPLHGQEVLAGLVADGLGLGQIPCTKVEGACASGGIAFRHAYLAVATGLCDVALAVGVEKMTGHETATVTAALNCAMDNRTFPGLFGLVWKLYAERYSATREDVSAVVRKNKANGLANPLAQMARIIDDEAIARSALICDPLRLFDCCPVSDGAAAVVLVAAHLADKIACPAVEVMASVQTRGNARVAGHPDLCTFGATVSAASKAYEMAGLAPSDLDFVELHDCFSIAEIVDDAYVLQRGRIAVSGEASEIRRSKAVVESYLS